MKIHRRSIKVHRRSVKGPWGAYGGPQQFETSSHMHYGIE